MSKFKHLSIQIEEGLRLPSLPEATPTRKELRPHQKSAVKAIVNDLDKPGRDRRTTAVMACGTGKTLVGLCASEHLGHRTLLGEPSLSLIAQNLREWRANYHGETPSFLVVCSDKSTVKLNADEARVTPEELKQIGASVTNSSDEIASFLRNENSKKIVLSTYHSMPLVSKALGQRGVKEFSCSVIDEAHRTATHEDSNFSLILDREKVPSRTRLFLTATPKIYTGDNGDETVYSMDDSKVYGKRSYNLPFSKAIEMGLLCDYQLVVATVTEKEAARIHARTKSEAQYTHQICELALLKASQSYGFSKVVSFHSSVRRAQETADHIEETSKEILGRKKIWSHSIDGTMPSATRYRLLEHMRQQPISTLSIVTNCRCLSEGVDVPALDCVTFFDKRSSEIDIVQAIGRIVRKSEGKNIGTVLVPVVIPEDQDPDTTLASSEFKKVWQVVRALKAHDDQFQIRCKTLFQNNNKRQESHGESFAQISFGFDSLPEILRSKLSTKIIHIGTGTIKDLLTEKLIIEWAKNHKEKTGKYPSALSGNVIDNPSETWNGINSALFIGVRGFKGGSTVNQLLKKYGLQNRIDLTEDIIIKWAEIHKEKTGKYPSSLSGTVIDNPSESWEAIDSALRRGGRGLKGGDSLSQLIKGHGLQNKADLSYKLIIKWAKKHKEKTGKYPSALSGTVIDNPSEHWATINSALDLGYRGLNKGSSISKLLNKYELTQIKKDLSESLIVKWANKHKEKTGKYPKPLSGVVIDNPSENWSKIDSALRNGHRGLEGGSSLPKLLKKHGLN